MTLQRTLSEAGKLRGSVWRQRKWRLRVVFNVSFLIGLSILDIRDLWYKLMWVGPYDAFAFDAGSRGTLMPTPLAPSVALPPLHSHFPVPLTSGWPSYLARCETLTAFCSPGSTFFLNAMGTNCAVGVFNETKTIERLVMTSNVRADAMAWAACQLVMGHRQPPLCQSNTVSNFIKRYRFQTRTTSPEWITPDGSAAEAELLRFIELIAMSYPRERIICTGGFAYEKPGDYHPTIFGCASPSLFRAEYVGVYATSFHKLVYDLAWLTAIDVITVVEMSYQIRQNTINVFTMDEQIVDSHTVLSVTETTLNNFVSSGLLYAVMITIDILLLCSQMYTGVELVTQWIVPLMRTQDKHDFEATLQLLATQSESEAQEEYSRRTASLTPIRDELNAHEERLFSQQEYTSFLTTSLYRHPVVIILTVVSQLLSWGIIMPNSVVWTWSLSSYPKLMAYFSSLRLWTLVLIAVNLLWDGVVFCSEKHAYYFARTTHITSFEIIAIGALVAFWKRGTFMAISEAKFAVEHQRMNDVVSFPTYIAHGNTFNEALDYSPITKLALLHIMYDPLMELLGWSVLMVAVRLVLNLVLARLFRWVRSLRMFAYKTQPTAGPRRMSWLPSLQPINTEDPQRDGYRRAAVEKLLNNPMRARSIVRPTMSMEKMYNGAVLLRPPIHLEFGLFVRERRMVTRTGFEYVVRAIAHLPVPGTPHVTPHTAHPPIRASEGSVRRQVAPVVRVVARQQSEDLRHRDAW